MGFTPTVNGMGGFTATVNGQSAFLASMAAVGPKGDKGDTGSTGVVTADFPLSYDSVAKSISIDLTAYATESWVDSQGYLVAGDLTPYLTSASAAATYYPLTNPSGYITSSALSGYATQSWVTGQGYITSSALSPYLTSATAASTYQTQAGMSAYYLASNPSGYITSSALSGYATESWVTGQGYITSSALSPYLTSSTAASTYQTISGMAAYAPLNSPTFTGTVTIPAGASISGYLTSATAASTYQTQSGMSSYLTTATAASTYAPLASPTFTGDPKAPTPTTSDNDTSIATTAFVNAYCPSASTTAAGKVELATDAEAVAASDTTLAITASNLMAVYADRDKYDFNANAFTAATSGTGASTTSAFNGKLVAAPTSATGNAILYSGNYIINRGGALNSGATWAKSYILSFRMCNLSGTIDSNSVGRVIFGKGNAVTTTNLSTRGFGIEFTVGGTLKILAHNGTSLTTYSTSHTVSNAVAIDIRLALNSSGTVECFVDGTSVGSTTGGPTSGSTSAGNAVHIEAENTATLTNTRLQFVVQNLRLQKAV